MSGQKTHALLGLLSIDQLHTLYEEINYVNIYKFRNSLKAKIDEVQKKQTAQPRGLVIELLLGSMQERRRALDRGSLYEEESPKYKKLEPTDEEQRIVTEKFKKWLPRWAKKLKMEAAKASAGTSKERQDTPIVEPNSEHAEWA